MRSVAIRFVFLLLVGLALLAWASSSFVFRTTRSWFEKDVALRARLAVGGARLGLVARWADGPERLGALLAEIAKDERILAAEVRVSDQRDH